ELLDVRSIGTKTVRVARIHGDRVPVSTFDCRGVEESVAGIDPAINPPTEGTGHAMRVLKSKLRVEGHPPFGTAVAILVAHLVDVGDAVACGSVGQWSDTDRDIQAVRKHANPVGYSIPVRVVEDP